MNTQNTPNPFSPEAYGDGGQGKDAQTSQPSTVVSQEQVGASPTAPEAAVAQSVPAAEAGAVSTTSTPAAVTPSVPPSPTEASVVPPGSAARFAAPVVSGVQEDPSELPKVPASFSSSVSSTSYTEQTHSVPARSFTGGVPEDTTLREARSAFSDTDFERTNYSTGPAVASQSRSSSHAGTIMSASGKPIPEFMGETSRVNGTSFGDGANGGAWTSTQGTTGSPASNQHTTSKPKPTEGKINPKVFASGFLGAILACALGFGGFSIWKSVSDGATSTVLGGSGGSIHVDGGDAQLAEAVAQKVLPSVVNIDVYTEQRSSGLLGTYSSNNSSETIAGLGSGVIISKDGYILTNDHVVEGAARLSVTLSSGNKYEAKLVGSDPSSDLAVIKIDASEELAAVQIGSSSDLTVGEWVMTAGSPYGLEQSVATGIVSAVNRSSVLEGASGTAYYTNMIQTDAAINPGNSGGALVDSQGALIGINTMIQSSSGQYSGVGFAIPVDYAMGIAEQIIDGKTPTHAQLGITTTSVNERTARLYGLKVNEGALVTSVNAGSGAESAGLQQGDVITKANGTTITSATELILAVRSVNPGDSIEIEYNRDGAVQTASVTLGSDEGASTQNSNSNSSNSYSSPFGYGYGFGY